MEKERLARQKRMRADAGLDEKDDEIEEVQVERPMKRQQLSSSFQSKRANANASAIPVASTSATESSVPMFYSGEFRPTATRHAVPRRDGKATFRLTDILGPVCACALH